MDDLRELDLYTPGFIAFDATVRLGSFTAAAEELNVTQPTISYRIKTLEERLGITLFLRRGRATELTFEGRVVLGQVRDDVYAFGVCTSHQTGPQRSKHGDRTLLSFVRRALDSSSTRALSDRRTRNKNEDSHDGYGPGGNPGHGGSLVHAWNRFVSRPPIVAYLPPGCYTGLRPSVRSALSHDKPLEDLARVDLIDLNDAMHPYLTWVSGRFSPSGSSPGSASLRFHRLRDHGQSSTLRPWRDAWLELSCSGLPARRSTFGAYRSMGRGRRPFVVGAE